MKPKNPQQTLPAQAANFGVDEAHSEDGVDLTLIRWMLSLTPAERLETVSKVSGRS
jgi:hypothetical protein